MTKSLRLILIPITLLVPLWLAGCGGGSGDGTPNSSNNPVAPQMTPELALEPNAPQVTGNTATDGFNWFNFRRQQLGLSLLARNSMIDTAAQEHSNYQKINNIITHVQMPGKFGFTGETTFDRLKAAKYIFTQTPYLYGEVISSTTDTSGFNAAENLIAAIYHRFVIFEPMFKEGGAGFAAASGGLTYFTTDFAANGLGTGVGKGNFVTYPFANQQRVPTIFYSDNESPDPVPNKNEVGYPISIHADATATVTVQAFTIQAHGGVQLPTQLLTNANDAHTATGSAAIIPLAVLAAATMYDVQFIGMINGRAVNRSWSFTTQ
jgi:uncharacterized protein YkwD